MSFNFNVIFPKKWSYFYGLSLVLTRYEYPVLQITLATHEMQFLQDFQVWTRSGSSNYRSCIDACFSLNHVSHICLHPFVSTYRLDCYVFTLIEIDNGSAFKCICIYVISVKTWQWRKESKANIYLYIWTTI